MVVVHLPNSASLSHPRALIDVVVAARADPFHNRDRLAQALLVELELEGAQQRSIGTLERGLECAMAHNGIAERAERIEDHRPHDGIEGLLAASHTERVNLA